MPKEPTGSPFTIETSPSGHHDKIESLLPNHRLWCGPNLLLRSTRPPLARLDESSDQALRRHGRGSRELHDAINQRILEEHLAVMAVVVGIQPWDSVTLLGKQVH